MAINYTPEYNKEIRDAVKHARAVQRRLYKRGIKLGVNIPTTSDLKARYQTRRELNRELSYLRKLSSRSDNLLKEVETSGGAKGIKWKFDYLKLNRRQAIEFFENEKRLELAKNPIYPGEKMRLNEIEENLQILNMDIDYMNQGQFREYEGAIKEYLSMPEKQRNGYRGFLWQLENSMRMAGYENQSINYLFNKFKKLSPSQFHEFYAKNDLIKRIYELVNSVPNGENKLTLSDDDARELIDTLFEEVDQDIAELS